MPELETKPKVVDGQAELAQPYVAPGLKRRKILPPFSKFKTDGGYDLIAAMKAGWSAADLKVMGFAPRDVGRAKQRQQALEKIKDFKIGENEYDIVAALKAGVKPSTLQGLGFAGVSEAKLAVQYEKRLEPFKTADGYDLAAAIKAGVDVPEIRLKFLFGAKPVAEAKKLVATHVQVGPKQEWVAKADYDKLTEPELGALQKGGVGELNKWRKETLAAAAKIETAVAAAKAEKAVKTWDELTEAQKKYVTERGLVAPRLVGQVTAEPQYMIQTLTGPMAVSKEVAEKYAPKAVITWGELTPAQKKYAVERGLVTPRLVGLEVTSKKGHTLSRKDFKALAPSQQKAFLEGNYEAKTESYGPLGKEEKRIAIVLPAASELKQAEFVRAAEQSIEYKNYKKLVERFGENNPRTLAALKVYWEKYPEVVSPRYAELARMTPKQQFVAVAEMFVPGLYVGRHWDELSAVGKAINIAIDAVFVGSFFRVPVARLLGKAMTRVKAIYTPTGARAFEFHVKALERAIKTGSARYITMAAKELRDLGKVMKVKNVPGAAAVIERANIVIRNANELARVSRLRPKVSSKIVDVFSKRVKAVAAEQSGSARIPQRQPVPPVPGKAPVKVLPWTRQEADRLAARGIGEKQLERAFERAGGNEWRARQIIRQMEQDAKHLTKQIDEALRAAEKRARISQESFYKKQRITLPTPAERVGVASARAERLAKLRPEVAASDLLGLQEKQVAEILAHMPKNRAVAIGRELKILRLRSYARHLERLGLEPTEALARELAELTGKQRAVALRGLSRKFQDAVKARLKALGKGRALPKVAVEVSSARSKAYLTAAVAANVRAFAQALAKADAKTVAKVEAKLSPAVGAAIAAATRALARGKAVTETLAKAETLARAETKAEAFGAVKPAFLTLTETKALTRAYTKLRGQTIGEVAPRIAAKAAARVVRAVRAEVMEISKVPRLQLAKVRAPRIGVRPAKPRPKVPVGVAPRERVVGPTGAVQVPITWKQGKNWVTLYPPYKSENVRWTRRPPRGVIKASGRGSAYRSIQALGGDATVALTADMGAMDVRIIRPRRRPTRAAIKFKRDPQQRTRSDITLSLQRVRGK